MLAYLALAIGDAHGAHRQTTPPFSSSQAPVIVERSVVLVGASARKLFNPCSRTAPQGMETYWNPTAQNLQEMNAALPAFLAEQRLPGPVRRHGIGNYYHQCAGFVRGGHQWIYISAFDSTIKDELETDSTTKRKVRDWRRDAVNVCDGCYHLFGVEYDVETKTFANFSFDGPSMVMALPPAQSRQITRAL